jgi:hypothetical protein
MKKITELENIAVVFISPRGTNRKVGGKPS